MGKGGTSASFHTQGTLHFRKEVFKISAIGEARVSAYSFRTQVGRLSGPPSHGVFTALSFLATVASVTDKLGSLSSKATWTFSDRGEYPCIMLTEASEGQHRRKEKSSNRIDVCVPNNDQHTLSS